MSDLIESIERSQLRRELPRFREGDRVRVHFQVVEGTRRRTQVFEGVVIRLQAKLYYLRGRVGRRARVRERRDVKPEDLVETISPAGAPAADGEPPAPEPETAGTEDEHEERGEPKAPEPDQKPEGEAEERASAEAGAEAEQEAATSEAGN